MNTNPPDLKFEGTAVLSYLVISRRASVPAVDRSIAKELEARKRKPDGHAKSGRSVPLADSSGESVSPQEKADRSPNGENNVRGNIGDLSHDSEACH
jgi:hypothetical protein